MKTKFLAITAALVAAFSLAGCASMCDPKDQNCIDNANNADEVIAGAAVIAVEIAAPVETTTTETRTCTKDRRGNETCTTTTNGN